MSRIQLENVKKVFGKVTALDGVTLDIKDKEFFVLFGPAGAGKTTILNCIAGINIPEEGVVKFDGEVMNLVDAAHRDTAMVFENYALYPQMTVYDNMASPLRSNLYKRDEEYIKNKIQEIAVMMKMENLLHRLPSQLSNGQKQRVAMGRALVRSPRVYLMDEPLAHLDAKLRNAMRTELKEIQANFGTTSVYVTHDFMEAMSLGDRIAIVNEGKILQIGTGDDIYYMPKTEFISQLMGDPEINIIGGKLQKDGTTYKFTFSNGGACFEMPKNDELYSKLDEIGKEDVDLGIRPQHITYAFEEGGRALKCKVYSYESIGNKSVIIAQYGDIQFRMIAPNGMNVKIDQDVYIDFKFENSIFFDASTKEYLTRYDEDAIKALSVKED